MENRNVQSCDYCNSSLSSRFYKVELVTMTSINILVEALDEDDADLVARDYGWEIENVFEAYTMEIEDVTDDPSLNKNSIILTKRGGSPHFVELSQLYNENRGYEPKDSF